MLPVLLPFLIGLLVAAGLYAAYHWWGFFVVFPWIGGAISFGIFLQRKLPRRDKGKGRRIALLAILPIFLLFIPLANNENLQLEGVVLLLLAGIYGKGVVHYAVAKVFGPLFWGRGFCAWGCWTAAVLEWLPLRKAKVAISPRWTFLRYPVLILSTGLPVYLVTVLGFDVHGQYLNRAEVRWMITGNVVYCALAVVLAWTLGDRRLFCRVLCPVSLIMKVPSRFSRLRIRPAETACVGCGKCDDACSMSVAVSRAISAGNEVRDTECIYCRECVHACPVGALK